MVNKEFATAAFVYFKATELIEPECSRLAMAYAMIEKKSVALELGRLRWLLQKVLKARNSRSQKKKKYRSLYKRMLSLRVLGY